MSPRNFLKRFRIDPAIPPYVVILFEACLFIHLTSSLIGWERKLVDNHGFRQCQTAITAYYAAQDGFKLAYETPVLGKPWSIPVEFPLYQWLVAAASSLLSTPLDQTGRFFSLIFFYLTLFPLYSLLRLFSLDASQRLVLLSLVLISPTYLFWPRTFMIESMALFLGILHLWAVSRALEAREQVGRWLLAAAVLGGTAGLVKITTFLAFCLPGSILFGLHLLRELRDRHRLDFRRYAIGALCLFVIPLAISTAWVAYADSLKELNPMAAWFLTSHGAAPWNFGTWAQRTSIETWEGLLRNSRSAGVLGHIHWLGREIPILLVLCFLALIVGHRGRMAALACLLFFLAPMAVFTNLYYAHDYYFYANNMFLIVFIGLSFLSALEARGRLGRIILAAVFLPPFLAVSFAAYLSAYPVLKGPNERPLGQLSSIIQRSTSPNDVLLICGHDWDATIPYYSRRRALMIPWWVLPKAGITSQALDNLQGEQVGAILWREGRDVGKAKEWAVRFGLDPGPIPLGPNTLFLRKRAP